MATPPLAAAAQADAVSRRASVVVHAVAALLLGALVIGAAGFSHLDVVHNNVVMIRAPIMIGSTADHGRAA